MEFKALEREPVEGFLVTIPDETDFYTWQVAIFGPPETPYEGGYFKVGSFFNISVGLIYITHCFFTQAEVKFPLDYPYSPPRLRFLTPILHPNVYQVQRSIFNEYIHVHVTSYSL